MERGTNTVAAFAAGTADAFAVVAEEIRSMMKDTDRRKSLEETCMEGNPEDTDKAAALVAARTAVAEAVGDKTLSVVHRHRSEDSMAVVRTGSFGEVASLWKLWLVEESVRAAVQVH